MRVSKEVASVSEFFCECIDNLRDEDAFWEIRERFITSTDLDDKESHESVTDTFELNDVEYSTSYFLMAY